MVTEKKKVCVTGAAGQTGRHILKSLTKHQDTIDICAAIHSADQQAQTETVKSICKDACVCPVDADDLDALSKAFEGVSDLFIVPTATESKVRHAFNYIRAARRAKVPFVAILSMSGCERRDYLWADQFWSIEEELKRSVGDTADSHCCILRSAFYLQNLLLYAQQYAEGYVPLPIGKEGRFAPVDVHDVGEAAAKILLDCKPHFNKTYTVTGPEAVTGPMVAEQLTEFCKSSTSGTTTGSQQPPQQQQLEWRDIPLNDAKQILLSANVPPAEVQGLIEFYRAVRERGAEFERPTEDLHKLIGRPPTTMAEWLKRIREHVLTLMRSSGAGGKKQQQQSSQPQSSQTA